jgi:hypothetical protein
MYIGTMQNNIATRLLCRVGNRKGPEKYFGATILNVDSSQYFAVHACDLVQLRVRDVAHGERVSQRTIVLQQKTQRPVQFEITADSGRSIQSLSGQNQSYGHQVELLKTGRSTD